LVKEPNPVEPKSIGIERPLYTGKSHYERVQHQRLDRNFGNVEEIPLHNEATATRKHFRSSDEDWRTQTTVLKCEGYQDQREKDACLKRAGVYLPDTQDRYSKVLKQTSDQCGHITSVYERKKCINSFMRTGQVPYFAQTANGAKAQEAEEDSKYALDALAEKEEQEAEDDDEVDDALMMFEAEDDF
jgi:hypothetical protein